jgi:hypothetical protein
VSRSADTIDASLSGLGVRFTRLDEPLCTAFEEHWAPFLGGDAEPFLTVELGAADHTIATDRALRPSVAGEVRDGGFFFRSDEGDLAVDSVGIALVRLGHGDKRWRFWGLMNLFAAALAVRMPSRPGALLHAAGVVIDGRAFLLVGPEGAGKSTFARAASEGGAQVVSDDVVLVDGAGGGLCLLGSPIRAHEATSPGPGRWPVAAILHARHGETSRLDAVNRVTAEAVLTANLPFVVSGWGRDARLDAVVAYLAQCVPHRLLTFAPDPSFVHMLRLAAF